jgi:hypothetical protein
MDPQILGRGTRTGEVVFFILEGQKTEVAWSRTCRYFSCYCQSVCTIIARQGFATFKDSGPHSSFLFDSRVPAEL